MSNVLVTKDKLDILANAIANKSGEPLILTLDEMVEAVDGIETPTLETVTKTYTPSTSAVTDTITASSGYNGLSTVSIIVNAIPSNYVGSEVPRRDSNDVYADLLSAEVIALSGYYEEEASVVLPTNSSSDITVSGATVSVERGLYPFNETKTVASGTAGTPTATKGTVSNHSVSVTPSVTNTTGYITGSTINGTAVTVSASELVSGSETKTINGTYDVTNLAELVVDVSGGGSSSIQVGTATVTASREQYIEFENLLGQPTSFVIISRDDIAIDTLETIASVIYDGTKTVGNIITNVSGEQANYDSSYFQHNYSSGTLVVYNTSYYFEAGDYKLVYTYSGSSSDIHTSDVQVGSGATSITFSSLAGRPLYWSCIFKSDFSTSSGYQRVISVANDGTVTNSLSLDSSAKASDINVGASYSGGSLTITSANASSGGYFHQPGYYQLTYAVDSTAPQYQTKTVSPSTSQQTVTADSGYDALEEVIVNAMPSMTLPSSTSATSSGTSKATISASSSTQYLNIPTGYNATAQYYTISASGGGGGSLTVATKTTTLNATSQTLSFSSLSGEPKYWFLRATTNVSSSGSTTYYYVTDCFYDGTSIKGNTFRIGSTRRVQNVTSGITQSYSGNTLTITAGSSSGATPGQFYGTSNFGYELIYLY